jgi:hypothetical protein
VLASLPLISFRFPVPSLVVVVVLVVVIVVFPTV